MRPATTCCTSTGPTPAAAATVWRAAPPTRRAAGRPAPSPRLAILALLLGAALAGCEGTLLGGAQSALAPAGRGAERIALLFWSMSGGAIVIWLAVVALSLWAGLRPRAGPGEENRDRASWLLIIGGGIALPTVVLAALLAWGLSMLPAFLAPAPPGSLKIEVTATQWWWRVRYLLDERAGGGTVELANELRLPVGESVELELRSPDVIHSLWIPSLGGKVDMIPGRTTRLVLEPTRTGVFRGVCAEYCGASHALMAFTVVVEERDAFARWLAAEARPAAQPSDAAPPTDAAPPSDPVAREGAALFVGHGCGACHTVRGTAADGVIGPDLTHVGSRQTLAAGILENSLEELVRFITHTNDVKPGVLMPSFEMLDDEDAHAIATWLRGLR
jgi:cytochrome c oxidase subunit II